MQIVHYPTDSPIGEYGGEIAQVGPLLALRDQVVRTFPLIEADATAVEWIPTEPGIWVETLADYLIDRPDESAERSGGSYYTIQGGEQALSIYLPSALYMRMFQWSQPYWSVEYKERPGQADEYGFTLDFQVGGLPRHSRLAPGYALGTRKVTRDIVHDTVVRRALGMLEGYQKACDEMDELERFWDEVFAGGDPSSETLDPRMQSLVRKLYRYAQDTQRK